MHGVCYGAPTLNSHPTATAQLYLDFDGDPANPIGIPEIPAYDQPASIPAIWARVAEKYAPFNLNVTTVDPGVYLDRQALRVVIGGDGAWTGVTSGGTSQVGNFYSPFYPNTVYVFPANLGNPAYVGEVAAHEAGHGFGLSHQALFSGTTRISEYETGDGLRAPIMGNSLHAARGLWWYGPTNTSTNLQDDLAILSGPINGFGYRDDDYGNTLTGASALSESATGVIEMVADADWFRFATAGGLVNLVATPGIYSADGATLDLRLELRDSAGNLITAADTSALGETISANLPAGTYYGVVASHGGYGDVGTYTVTVPETIWGTVAALGFWVLGRRVHQPAGGN